MDSLEKQHNSEIIYRKPSVEDGKNIYDLVKDSEILDVNSVYLYLLLCTHFNETTIVAQSGNEIIGFISGYLIPVSMERLFIWQVAVNSSFHRYGLATSMAVNLLKRPSLTQVSYIEATVTPSNIPSALFFRSLAKKLKTECRESDYFGRDLFDSISHEEERLFSIGPFKLEDLNEIE